MENNMIGIIFLGLVLLIAIYYMVNRSLRNDVEKLTKEYEEKLKLQDIFSETNLIHIGGHPYLQTNDKILLQIKNNNSIYFYKEDTDTGKEIPLSRLTRYEIKTETEIQKDVTLMRLLTLGILAFGVKKKTKTEAQFLILSYTQNGVEVNCIFKNWYVGQKLGDITGTLNRLRIEMNEVKEG